MKEQIKQVIINDDTVLLFTQNPNKDIVKIQEAYANEDDIGFHLGYEMPKLVEYGFLGVKYECISLWFDNEDIPDFFITLNNKR